MELTATTIMLRACPGCERRLELGPKNFYRNKSKSWGYDSYCKPCANGYTRANPNYLKNRRDYRLKRKEQKSWATAGT